MISKLEPLNRNILIKFQSWLAKHYNPNWTLTNLIVKGIGFHNGRLHRSLSQIQIRLFEEKDGLDRLISTTSIIEGVNTAAEIVVLWSNKSGRAGINNFTYKNIIGRGGRMFRHFVGKIFILEKPPEDTPVQLQLDMPDELLGISEYQSLGVELTSEQIAAMESYNRDMQELLGSSGFNEMLRTDVLQANDSDLITTIAKQIKRNLWKGVEYLNSENPQDWDRFLYKLINLEAGAWGAPHRKLVAFVKILSRNWHSSIPELLRELEQYDIGIDLFFELERNTAFRLSALLGDVQTIYNRINSQSTIDVTLAINRFAHAFLPKVVYQLEEYGLPRVISRKINRAGIINFDDESLDIYEAMKAFRDIGKEELLRSVGDLEDFDHYILDYFYDGISFDSVSVKATSS